MNKTLLSTIAAAALIGTAATGVAFADGDHRRGGHEFRGGHHGGQGGPGMSLMNPEEMAGFREAMRNAESAEERATIRESMRETVKRRAQERGREFGRHGMGSEHAGNGYRGDCPGTGGKKAEDKDGENQDS